MQNQNLTLKPKQKNFQTQSFLELGKPLYLQDVGQETMEGSKQNNNISGLDKYGYRLLSMASNKPGLWIHDIQDTQYIQNYLSYVQEVSQIKNQIQTLGINLENQNLTQAASNNLDMISEYNCESLIPFIMSESSEQIADSLNLACFERHTQSEKMNNKGIFLEICKDKGIPTPFGSMYTNQTEAWNLFNSLRQRGSTAFYSKLSRSASGQGIQQFSFESPSIENDFKSYLTNPDTIANMEQFGIRMDEAIIFDKSPAISFWMSPTSGLQIVNTNYQVLAKKSPTELNPTVHKGAYGPIDKFELINMDSIIRKTEEILKENHAYGPGSLDLISRTNMHTCTREDFIVEINKRITGGYHNFLAQQFGFTYFRSDCNLFCPSKVTFNQLVEELNNKDLLWTTGKNSGTFIVNYQTAPVHEKIAVISFGQNQDQAERTYQSTKELIAKL